MQTKEKLKCFAKTRRGGTCQTLPVTGRKRCRMHGGTNNGAPKSNKNAFKHGRYSREVIENRKRATQLKREWKAFFYELNKSEF
jgi:hypothetical protein